MKLFLRRTSDTASPTLATSWKAAIRFRQEVLGARQHVLRLLLGSVYDGPGRIEPCVERTARIALLLCDDLEASCEMKIHSCLYLSNSSSMPPAIPLRRVAGGPARRLGVTLIKAAGKDPGWKKWLWRSGVQMQAWLGTWVLNRRRGLGERILDVASVVEKIVFDPDDHGYVNLVLAREAALEMSARTFDPIVVDALMRAWPALEALHQKMDVA